MEKKGNNKKTEEMIEAVGATAEMSLVFYRAALGVGASVAEATRLTQAYLAALLFGNQQNPGQEGEDAGKGAEV